MTKSTKILITVMAVILLIFGILLAVDTKSSDADSKKIAELSYKINELRKEKEACFNKLTLEESRQYFEWFTKPCIQWDEQIMLLREQENQLKAKSYDVGLDMSS